MLEKLCRTPQSQKLLLPSTILWIIAIILFLLSVSVRDPRFASDMTMTFRALISVLFIWHALLAIISKGTFYFAMGFCVTFALILFLKHAYGYDPSEIIGRWIHGSLPKVKVITADTMTFKSLLYNSTRDGSLLFLSAIGGFVALLAGVTINQEEKSTEPPGAS